MTDLPPGWEFLPLRDIGDWYGGGTPSKSKPHFWNNGTVPWLSPKDMGPDVLSDTHDHITSEAVEESATRLVPANSVSVVMRSGILERKFPVTLVPFETTLNQDMRAVFPFDGIDSRWVAWGLRSLQSYILQHCRKAGTTVASIETPRLMEMLFPVPPLVEQQRIIAVLEGHLSRLDFGVAQLQKALLRIDNMREYTMAAACTGGLDVETDDLPPPELAAVGVVDGELPKLPSSWRWARLSELAEVVGGITKDSKKQSDPSVPMVPYLRVANVQRGHLELSKIAYIRVSEDKAEKLRLQHGDVLLNEGGDRDKLGRGWIWEGQIDQCIHQNHVFRARIHCDVIHSKLLAWHANGFGRKWFEANGKQSVNLASISLSKIKMFPVPVPPKALQEGLVSAAEARLSVLDRSEALIQEALVWSNSLRRSLLREAFSGGLLPQDPADEPASELLARIRAGRAAQSQPKRARRATPKESPAASRTEWPDAGHPPVSYEQEELL